MMQVIIAITWGGWEIKRPKSDDEIDICRRGEGVVVTMAAVKRGAAAKGSVKVD